MAKACAPHIRVNAIAPGLILTEWAERFSQEQITGWTNGTALKRVPTPEDIAATYGEYSSLGCGEEGFPWDTKVSRASVQQVNCVGHADITVMLAENMSITVSHFRRLLLTIPGSDHRSQHRPRPYLRFKCEKTGCRKDMLGRS